MCSEEIHSVLATVCLELNKTDQCVEKLSTLFYQ